MKMTTSTNLSQAYRAAVEGQPVVVSPDRLARVLGAVGSRNQRDQDLSLALQDPAFVAALRIGAALQADAEALSADVRRLSAPLRQRPLQRALPFGWGVAASVAMAALVGLALQPMQPTTAPLVDVAVAGEGDLITSVSFEKSDRESGTGVSDGSIFVDRFDS